MGVRFEPIHVGGKGPRAMAVTLQQSAGARAPSPRRGASNNKSVDRTAREPAAGNVAIVLAWCLMAVWLAAVGWGVTDRRLPGWVLPALLLVNIATFWSYRLDKHAALKRQWRTPESQLHLLALLGGWPAAWWAQQTLRHKSVKPAFRRAYAGTVALHCGGLAAWLMAIVPRLG